MTKKILYTVIISLVCTLFLNGAIGIKGGINYSDLSLTSSLYSGFDVSSSQNQKIGVYTDLHILGPLTVQAELNYSKEGAVYKYDGSIPVMIPGYSQKLNNQFSATYKVKYLEIPILAKFTFITPFIKPYILAGPYYKIKLSEDLIIESPYFTAEETTKVFAKSDKGFIAGAGVKLSLAAAAAFIELRYSRGSKDVSVGDYTIKNRSFSLLFGIEF